MDEQAKQQPEQTVTSTASPDASTAPAPVAPVSAVPMKKPEQHSALAATINRVTAFTLIITALIFALISIMAIWKLFGDNTNDVVWQCFSSLATIAFAALVVNVGTKLLDQYMDK